MFSKSRTPAAKGPAARQPSTPSLISAGLRITGDLKCDGEIQIDGEVIGDVDCERLIVGEKAVIKGEVIAETVVVRGEIHGRVCGRDVSLAKSSRVIGDIMHQSLSMEAGAHLEGQVRKVDDPRAPIATNIPKLLQTNGGPLRSVEPQSSGGARELASDATAGA
jgi:cytoskeletal protein CcmA (bactofilin family)